MYVSETLWTCTTLSFTPLCHGGSLTASPRLFYPLCSVHLLDSGGLPGPLLFLLGCLGVSASFSPSSSLFPAFSPPKLGHPLKSSHSDVFSVFLSGRNQRVIYQEVADEISLNCLVRETGQWFFTSVKRVFFFLRNMGQTTLEEELTLLTLVRWALWKQELKALESSIPGFKSHFLMSTTYADHVCGLGQTGLSIFDPALHS